MLKRRWIIRTLFSVLAVSVLVGGGLGLMHYINTPSKSVITASVPRDIPQPVNKIDYQGRYAEYEYSSDFKPVNNDPPVAPQLEVASFVAHRTESLLLSIQVLSLPSDNINDNGSYMYRKTYPNRYTQTTETINGGTVYIMSETTAGTYNKAAFFVHGGKIATVNLSGGVPSGGDNQDQTLQDVIASWQWRD